MSSPPKRLDRRPIPPNGVVIEDWPDAEPSGEDWVMDMQALREWLEGRTARHEFSGVALVWRDGAPMFTYSGGLAHRGHGVPITGQTRFAVASVTKMVTASAALRLVERGLLALDQPLVEVLPPEHQPIGLTREHTLHHLLSHTSGLANYHDDDAKDWGSFTSNWDHIPTYNLRHPADMLPLFADLPAVFQPGSRFQYNDAAFILAGLVIEAVSGRPFADVVTDEVLQPGGMVDTTLENLDREPVRMATGYVIDDGPPASWRANNYSVPTGVMPDGGLITTAQDLARLIDALLSGVLLTPAMSEAMMTPQGPPSDAVEQYGYGCWLVVENGEVTIIGHGGSDPGVSSLVTHHRRPGTTIVVLCNYDRGSLAATKHIEEALGLADPRP
jgi:CubicO group peptidase (beta-lactamase class C family)